MTSLQSRDVSYNAILSIASAISGLEADLIRIREKSSPEDVPWKLLDTESRVGEVYSMIEDMEGNNTRDDGWNSLAKIFRESLGYVEEKLLGQPRAGSSTMAICRAMLGNAMYTTPGVIRTGHGMEF